MSALRPFLFAILGAFVAAAPAAPVPGRAKKERKSPAGYVRGHDQKLEEPEKRAPAEVSAHGATVCIATGSERAPAPAGEVAADGDHDSFPYPCHAVATASTAPIRDFAAPQPADLRAGLLDLPPPRALRCT